MDSRRRTGPKKSAGANRRIIDRPTKEDSISQEDEAWEDAEEEDGYSSQHEEGKKSHKSGEVAAVHGSQEEDWEECEESADESENPTKTEENMGSEMQETKQAAIVTNIIQQLDSDRTEKTDILIPEALVAPPVSQEPVLPTATLPINFHFSEDISLELGVIVKIKKGKNLTVKDLWDAVFESLHEQGIKVVSFDIFLDDRQLVINFSKPNHSDNLATESPNKAEGNELELARHISEGQKSRKSRAKSDKRKDKPDSKLGSKKTSKIVLSTTESVFPTEAIENASKTAAVLGERCFALTHTELADIEFTTVDVLVQNPANYHTVKTDLTKESVLFATFCLSVNQGTCITAISVVPATGFLKGTYILTNELSWTVSHLEIDIQECIAGIPVMIPLKNSLRVEKGDVVRLTLCPDLPFSGLVYVHHQAKSKSLGSDGSLFHFTGQIPVSAVYYTTSQTA